MCVHVSTLPDECLLPIFDRIPMLNLLRLDQVCARWAQLLPSATARRRTLVLILGGYRVDEIDYSNIPFNDTCEVSFGSGKPYLDLPVAEREASLTLPALPSPDASCPTKSCQTEMARLLTAHHSGQLVAYFKGLFPNVTTLVMIHPECREAELCTLIDLLGSWSLVTLKLWFCFYDIDRKFTDRRDRHPVRILLDSIGQQSSLRQLSLDIDGDGDLEEDDLHEYTFPIECYSFIAQLNVAKLHLGNYNRHNALWDIVHRYDHAALHTIGLGKELTSQLDAALDPKFDYTHKVRQLYWKLDYDTAEQLSELCLRFAGLTTLEVYWNENITFTQLASNLALLTQLTHLKLDIFFQFYRVNTFALKARAAAAADGGGVDGEEEGEEPPRISLPQVKIVEFIISLEFLDFESLSPAVFPSAEVIILKDCAPLMHSCITYDEIMPDCECIEMAKRRYRRLVLLLKSKFANSAVRLYAKHGNYDGAFADWTNYVRTEADDADDLLPIEYESDSEYDSDGDYFDSDF